MDTILSRTSPFPINPMILPTFGSSCHASSIKSFICKTEITFIPPLGWSWKTVQEFSSGNGNVELKKLRKLLLVWKCYPGTLPKGCDGMSVRALESPLCGLALTDSINVSWAIMPVLQWDMLQLLNGAMPDVWLSLRWVCCCWRVLYWPL
jgi:hypothetical protein